MVSRLWRNGGCYYKWVMGIWLLNWVIGVCLVWVFMPTPTGNGDSFLEPSPRPPWPPVLFIQTPELFRGGPGPEQTLQVAVGGFLLYEALRFPVSLERLVCFLWSPLTSPPAVTILSFRLDEFCDPSGVLVLVLLPPASEQNKRAQILELPLFKIFSILIISLFNI